MKDRKRVFYGFLWFSSLCLGLEGGLGALGPGWVLETTAVPTRDRQLRELQHRKVHHCDMALDLALTLVYLEDLRSQARQGHDTRDPPKSS